MFKTILVPTDGSELSYKAVQAAAQFARETGARLIGVAVSEPYNAPPVAEGAAVFDTETYNRKMQELARQSVARVAEAAQAAGVNCETLVRASLHPHEEIVQVAKDCSCDVIFMASHGRKGLSALFVGSVTHKVLAHSTIPVLVFR